MTSTAPSSSSTAYASGISYRAFGAVKSMSLNTAAPTGVTMTYDNALRPLTYEADNSTTSSNNYVQKANYTYHNDGTVNEVDSQRYGPLDTQFDRKNEYDFAGRLKKSAVGPSGGTHYEILTYNAFNKLTSRKMQTYGLGEIDSNNSYSSTGYDSAGNAVTSTTAGPNLQGGSSWHTTTKNWWYDAAGRMSKFKEEGSYGPDMHVGGETTYDGDGRPVKHTELVKLNYPIGWGEWTPFDWYYIYSSVTGQKILDIYYDGTPSDGKRVYMGGTVIFDTTHQGPFAMSNGTQAYTAIGFKVTDPVTGSTQEMETDGSVPLDASTPTIPGNPNARNEIAGLGTSIPSVLQTEPYTPNLRRGGYAGNADCIIQIDGMEVGRWNCSPSELAGADTSMDVTKQQTGWKVSYKSNLGKQTRHFSMSETGRMLEMLEGGERITSTWSSFASSASFLTLGGGLQTTAQFPSDLRKRLVDRGNNCSDFLKRYFASLSKSGKFYSDDLGTLFDRIGASRFIVDSKYISKHGSSGQTRGMATIRKGNRYVYSVELNNIGDAEATANNYTAVAMAELLHHAKEKGKYSDRELDNAALRLLTPEERDKVRKENKNAPYGTIGHNAVSSHCSNKSERTAARVRLI